MSKKIKILYTIPNFDTAGSGKVVYDLVKGIDKTKFLPEIMVKHQKGVFYKEIEKLGVPIHVFSYETKYKPYFTFPFRLLKVVRFFKSHRWDVIHSWHWSSDFSEALAAKLAGIPFVYTKKAMGWGNKAWRWKSILSTHIIAINESMMTQLFYKLPPEKTSFLPLGLDTETYKPTKQNQQLLEYYNIKETDFVVISVVNMVPVKGMETLIEAVINSKIKDVKLVLVGDYTSQYGYSLKNTYTNEFSQIIFTGKQQDVKAYLSLADVFVIPTKNEGKKEGMPMAPVEAMAMGVPVLGSRVSGITDILKGFEEYLFEAENVASLSQLLITFNNLDDKSRKEIGLRMREKVVSEYNFKKFIATRENLYKSIVSKKVKN